MERVLEKISFQKFLEDLKRKYKVIGPIRKGGATSTYSYACFAYIEELEDLEINYKSSMLSPKMIFFPDNQELYKYEETNSKVRLTDLRDIWNENVVILGLHPCDIAAISCLDKVFTEEGFEDQYYRAKREKSIIIGLTCTETKASCFCNIVDSGPDIETGYDLLMTDIGDGYFFRAGTELGRRLISADYFRDITEEDSNRRRQEIGKITKELPPKLGIDNIQKVMREKYGDDLWAEFSDRCLTCGSCNMVCPTCHCFSIIDKTNSDRTEGMRVLVWDSCHFERFALMAGNINVRKEKGARFKHRIHDKYYYDAKRYGTVFCVGCGRCLEFCPSHIDIRAALKKLEGV